MKELSINEMEQVGGGRGGVARVGRSFTMKDESNGGREVMVGGSTFTTVWSGNPSTKYKLNGIVTVPVGTPVDKVR